MKKIILSSIFTFYAIFIFSQTIAEIQGSSNDSPFVDQEVSTSGIITATGTEGYFLQDGNNPRSGIYIYDNTQSPQVGDSVNISGTVQEFFNLTELVNITAFEIVSSGNTLPDPVILTTAEMHDEDYEGMLVRAVNATCTNTDIGFGEWELNDGSGPVAVDDLFFLFSPMLNTIYSVTGPLTYSFSAFKIEPRSADDVVIDLPLYFTETPKETNIAQTELTIQWKTNIAATSEVTYGLTPALELGTISLEILTTDHEIMLPGLSPATIYYVRASSTSGADETPTSIQVMSTASNSSGDIKVYFNQPVDHSVATGELAVYTEYIIDTIIYYIDNSQHTLDVTMYETENQEIVDAINAAYDRSVQVRVISDVDESTNNAVLDNLNPNIPLLKGNSVGIMHDKFILIDQAHADNSWVMTGSMNHTINNLGWDYNNVICIQDQSLVRAYTLEFNEMWGSDEAMPNEANAKFGSQKLNNTPHCFNINGIPVELYFSPSDGTSSKLAQVLNKAENEIAFALLIFTENSLGNAIRDAHVAGLDVKGIIDLVGSNGSEFNFLTGEGVNVLDYQNADGSQWPDGPQFHHKYAILDYATGNNPVLITGSHNWTASANSIHDENTLIIKDATLANIYFQEFNARFNDLLNSTESLNVLPLRVFPNPVSDVLTIDAPEAGTLWLSDFSGKVLFKKDVTEGHQELKTASLPLGIYYLRLNNFVGKVVKIQP